MKLPADPQTLSNGKCVECGKPKKRTRRAAEGADKEAQSYTRQNRKLWLIHLDRDAFCSRDCCERWHRLILRRPPKKVCAHLRCSKRFALLPTQPSQRFCSKKCRDAEKKIAKYDIPGRCTGCGGDRGHYSKGCSQCADRRRSRARRADPHYVTSELEKSKVRRREQREAMRLEKAA